MRGYRGQPPRLERKVRFQIQVERDQEAITWAMFKAGWRIYLTNAPQTRLSFTGAVLAYRDQYVITIIPCFLFAWVAIHMPVIGHDVKVNGRFHHLFLFARNYEQQQC